MNLADKIKLNVQTYKSQFNKKQKEYIKFLFKEIDKCSKRGMNHIETMSLDYDEDWYTYEFYKSIPEIFEKEGFSVKEESTRYGLITSWWVISWQ